MTAATVAAVGDPSLRGIISGDSAGYDQSSGIIGRSIEDGGWTVSITDCVGDESYCYIGVEVEAPEGTVLDGDYYLMNAEFDSDMLHKGNGGGRDSLLRPLPDDDPTDNKVRMVYTWSELGAGLSGARVRLRLTNFYRLGTRLEQGVSLLWPVGLRLDDGELRRQRPAHPPGGGPPH